MKHIIYYMVLAFVALTLTGCVGEHNDYEITDNKVVLEASTTSFFVDNPATVTFTVTYNGADVTAESAIFISDTQTGELTDNGGATFTTTRPGVYKFVAYYNGYLSEQVTVRAKSAGGTGNFYRRLTVMLFTGTWCQYCPNMHKAIEAAEKEIPDRMIPIACHSQDEFTIEPTNTLISRFRIQGFPTSIIDYRQTISTSSSIAFTKAINTALDEYPAACGVAITSTLANGTATIEVKAKFIEQNDYKIGVLIVEDGIVAAQAGVSSPNYTHNEVLRATLTNIEGDALGNCTAGQEVTKQYTFTPSSEMVAGNCRVIAFVMAADAASGKDYINNVTTCPIDGSVGYQYEESEE